MLGAVADLLSSSLNDGLCNLHLILKALFVISMYVSCLLDYFSVPGAFIGCTNFS